jgi:formylglycine-generating enzyme required for sulfatase activity
MSFQPTHSCNPVWRVAEDIELIQIPAGAFLMGSPPDEAGRYHSERPQHLVTVPEFWMGKYPVTQAQYKAVMGENPSRFNGPNRPVEQVSWNDAVAFCEKLSQIAGRTYRLPSEAEWEYACRAGTTTPFYFGEIPTTDLANYDGNYTYGSEPKGVYRKETTDVGTFPANQFGLHDMHGNVWEWCQDNWHKNYKGAPIDGSAWLEGGYQGRRVLRGGSWCDVPKVCKSAIRIWLEPTCTDISVGFRVVCGSAR